MAKIRNGDIASALEAINLIRRYKHPLSRAGIRNDLMVKLTLLARELREASDAYMESHNEIAKRYGEEKVPGQEATLHVEQKDADGKVRSEFLMCQHEQAALSRQYIEVPDRLKVKHADLRVRDEEGVLVEIELGEIGFLWDLLILEEESPTET